MNFIGTGWALLPAVVAIVLALKTKEVYISLFIGIFIGALLFNDFHLFKAILSVFEVMMERLSSTWNIGILIFLVFLGITVALMTRAGGSQAYGNWATRTIKNQKMALLSSFGLGVLIFVDDYFNCLTVGSVMRDICDRFKISRAKLAYIIDATAAPICIIAPISSWAAAVTGYTTGDGFTLFLQTIPFNLYALLTIAMVLCVIFFDINIGKMKEHEQAARQGDVFNGKCDYGKAQEMEVSDKGKVYDLVLPVIFLIVSCILCMVYTGGFFDGVPFVTAFSQCDASLGLVIGSFLTLIFMFLLYMPRKVITYNDFTQCIPQGFKMMVPAMTILTLAWTLGSFVSVQLEAGVFVQEMLNTYNIPLFILPPVLFLVATGLAFSTGTSWGTFAILIPIVTDIFASGSSMLVISIASILAGAVCGDHVSPISDTTIMASAGAQCNHVYHVSTQLPYAMVVAISCFAGYIVAGITHNVFFTFIAGLCTLFLILFCIVKKNKQNNN